MLMTMLYNITTIFWEEIIDEEFYKQHKKSSTIEENDSN